METKTVYSKVLCIAHGAQENERQPDARYRVVDHPGQTLAILDTLTGNPIVIGRHLEILQSLAARMNGTAATAKAAA